MRALCVPVFHLLASLGVERAVALLAVCQALARPALTTRSTAVSLQVLVKWTLHPCFAFPLGPRAQGSFLAHSCHCVKGPEGHGALLRWTFSGHSPDGIDFRRACTRSSLAVARVPPAALCCPLPSAPCGQDPQQSKVPPCLPLERFLSRCHFTSRSASGARNTPGFGARVLHSLLDFLGVVLMVRTCSIMLSLSPLRKPWRSRSPTCEQRPSEPRTEDSMATAAPLRSLEEEVTCSVCLDYLRDPVTIDCGHVFCRSCTADICPASGARPVCPLCKKPFKKENIRPVWQLASLVENIERLKVDKGRQLGDAAREQQDVRLCERHQEKLHYYCEDDGQLLCVLCRESREHKPHTAVLLEKAAQPHREKILNHLSILRRDRDKIQGCQAKGEADILAALQKLREQRQHVVAEFAQGHQFLREREQHLLDQLARLEQELAEGREKCQARGSGELARLALVISELEGKAQQPAAELMQTWHSLPPTCCPALQLLGLPVVRKDRPETPGSCFLAGHV
ncbi:PREDICTED: tripartite motif-containing protein 26 isoform X5 [Myotis brandtii]|uniref:tripartite motif-containing protein 26 isoform X5 n=1 Tax=Myotis brandtii TaxID=109478 RepID=UPI0007045CEA|nr:PREDICTED: tripartite motif-containing protein 26 isoform X5 [Myotis brandtii]